MTYRLITATVASGVSAAPCSSMLRRSRKYCTYRSGVNVLSRTSGSSPGLAKVCGAPGGIIARLPAGAS
jgi:hypothetical protein